MMSSLNRVRPHAAVVIAYLGIGLIPILKAHKGMRLLNSQLFSIDPLTSQSTAFEHNRSATESGLKPLSLSLSLSLS